MSNIFISYRRGDSIATAGRIRDRLVQQYGRPRVFVDVDDIPHGRDFVKVLQDKVAECGVLLAIIGPSWTSALDEKGNRRIDDPHDFVGIEIGSALKRGEIAVIPVLVDGAKMPVAEELPEYMKPLARRNAIELRNTQFGTDVERLIRSIDAVTGGGRGWGKMVAGLAVVAALGAAGVAGWPYVQQWRGEPNKVQAPGSQPPGIQVEGQREATAITPLPAQKAAPAASVNPGGKEDIAAHLLKLQQALRPAGGRVDVKMSSGTRVPLGKDIVFEITARNAGRLMLIDVNADNEVTQIFPNQFVKGEQFERVPAGRPIAVPGPGYGFTGFRASEPVGRGVVLALVLPSALPVDGLTLSRAQIDKGFQPVNSPVAYLNQLIGHIAGAIGDKGKGPPEDWAFTRIEYEIVR